MTGTSNQGIKTVFYPVTDLARAKPVYAALLGVEPSGRRRLLRRLRRRRPAHRARARRWPSGT